jgi:hypothetical protein
LSNYPTISDVLKSACGGRNQHLVEDNGVVKKRRKYRNKPCEVDGIKFDSEKEAKRYSELKLLLKIGEIGLLERQKPFLLIEVNETERKCVYVADFVYWDTKTGKQIVEDVKGIQTDVFKIKKKLMKEVHGIEIKIV